MLHPPRPPRLSAAEALAALSRRTPQAIKRPSSAPSEAYPRALAKTASLASRTSPLTREEARHLLRRAGYVAPPAKVDALVGLPANEAVDQLIADALSAPLPPEPDWATQQPPGENASDAEVVAFFDMNFEWAYRYAASILEDAAEHPLRSRMTVFWHNHFVTEIDIYALAAFGYRNLELFRGHGLGSFKFLVREIGIQPAMLLYLDGFLNQASSPNENYARELLELFTTGIIGPDGSPNYTETDIEELARALTGWIVRWRELQVDFLPFFHDGGQKTILGRTGNFGYDDVIDLIFEERPTAIAHFVSAKIYREFVQAEPDSAIVEQLATTFLTSDFDVASVVRQLLSSEHFFDLGLRGAQIKNPIEFAYGLPLESPLYEDPEYLYILYFLAADLGQFVLQPPNVAGWEGGRTWITTSTLAKRWDYSGFLIWGRGEDRGEEPALDMIGLADLLHDRNAREAPFELAVRLAEHVIGVPVDQLSVESGVEFIGDLNTFPIPDTVAQGPAVHVELAKRMLNGWIPWYDWDLNADYASDVLRVYLTYLFELPELQLA